MLSRFSLGLDPVLIELDMGMSTISVHHGGLVNVWLIWPPTMHNWNFYYTQRDFRSLEDRSEVSCFGQIGKYLSGGQIVILKPGEALFLPPGWLSFSYSLKGGYMTKLMIISPEMLSYALTSISRELRSFQSGNLGEIEANIMFFLHSLSDYMQDPDPDVAVYAVSHWIGLIEVLIEITKVGYIIGSRIVNKVANVLGDIYAYGLNIICPCGKMTTPFGHHFLVHGLGMDTPDL